jgi:hypothetical protein
VKDRPCNPVNSSICRGFRFGDGVTVAGIFRLGSAGSLGGGAAGTGGPALSVQSSCNWLESLPPLPRPLVGQARCNPNRQVCLHCAVWHFWWALVFPFANVLVARANGSRI